MDWDVVARVIPALVTSLAALLALLRGPNALRTRIKHDAELIEKMPEGSRARTTLLDFIDQEIKKLATYDIEARRDMPMFVFALITAPLIGYLTIWLIQRGEWWSYAASSVTGFTALALVYGVFETAQKVPRDEKGRVRSG